MVKRDQRPLPIERACGLLAVSRDTWYRQSRPAPLVCDDLTELRDRIERLTLDFPGYGYRRVTKQLQREGWLVNHKRVLGIMRAECLLCQLRRRWVRTTDSEHGLRVWPNLLRGLTIDGLDQVWVADITYIRLPGGFCYLAAILDAHSRRVVGWQLSEHIDAALALDALDMALAQRASPAVHHSDRGVQYACRDYVDRLRSAGVLVSMSAKGKPRDNAQAESFFRTLKVEE